jgi:hypothetical protein
MSVDSLNQELEDLVVEGGYTVSMEGIINDPGKFEGEPAEILYFYEATMNGSSDESGEGWDAFDLSEEEKMAFEIPAKYSVAVLHYSDQGFVNLEYGTAEDFEEFANAHNDEDAEADIAGGFVIPDEEQGLDDLHGLAEGALGRGQHFHHRDERQKRNGDSFGQSYDKLGHGNYGAEPDRQRRYRDLVRSSDPAERTRAGARAQHQGDIVASANTNLRSQGMRKPIEGPKGTLPESRRREKLYEYSRGEQGDVRSQSYDGLASGYDNDRQRRYKDMVTNSAGPYKADAVSGNQAKERGENAASSRSTLRSQGYKPKLDGPKGTLPEAIREARGRSTGWDVFLNGEWIDTVFGGGTDPGEIKRELVDDGYDPRIIVKKEKKGVKHPPPQRDKRFDSWLSPEPVKEAGYKAPVKGRSIGWDVYLNGKWIDTVFDIETDPVEVKRSLVNHDGYDPGIVVKKGKYSS